MLSSLQSVVSELMAPKKGILAADESVKNMNTRLEHVGLEKDDEMRRRYREVLITTPDLESYLTGIILFDETLRQNATNGTPFIKVLMSKGIIPGIKVDKGTRPLPHFPGEEVTEGLDALGVRLREYFEMGVRFAKWRAVIKIGNGLPSEPALLANAHALAQYAALCQEEHIVPMVEPEVLYSGTHTLEQSAAIISATMQALFSELDMYKVDLSGLILKTSMALPGKESGITCTAEAIADETLRALNDSVPKEVGGVVFLSGGQTPVEATEHLNAIERGGEKPWPITFSYSRALQEPVLNAWGGRDGNVAAAQKQFVRRLTLNAAAREGKYTDEMERVL